MNFLRKMHGTLMPFYALAIVFYKSLKNRLKARKHKTPSVRLQNDYKSQSILLLALYEKGQLRTDIINLLKAAKQKELYVIAVNTESLRDIDEAQDLIDCYIERYNFGRDFGSYKEGFMHIFKQGWNATCPKLLMLNDSVFYSKNNLSPFLDKLCDTNKEVLGATENYEISHHLGSFCIAISGELLTNDKFISYWKAYKNTDIRPFVIKKGEMELSKVLRACVSAPAHFGCLFNTSWYSEILDKNPQSIDKSLLLARKSDRVHWETTSPKHILSIFFSRYRTKDILGITNTYPNRKSTTTPDAEDSETRFTRDFYLTAKDDHLLKLIESFLTRFSDNDKHLELEEPLRKISKAELVKSFMQGSQLHQNGPTLFFFGCPIIKLDGVFRGVYSTEDIDAFCALLPEDEITHFRELMYSKPYGGTTLYGWKRAAFNRGLI